MARIYIINGKDIADAIARSVAYIAFAAVFISYFFAANTIYS